ncbi:MAG: rhomboid family intramembrane serine protease [Bacteroidota bacterium]|nr:rhomboid family intramembrane serine protease [Bacteroidota bacterium]
MTPSKEEKQKFYRALYLPVILLIAIWGIKGFELLTQISLAEWGIFPLKAFGLPGILFSPLLHADINHLINNSVPLLVLNTALFYFYRPIAFKILILIWLTTGLCVWFGGREAYHIGASSIIYGDASFLFFSGVIRRNIKLMAISLLTIFLYGGMVWGIFPILPEISWESHLFGGLTGLFFAFVYASEGPQKEEPDWDEDSDDDPYWEQPENETNKP